MTRALIFVAALLLTSSCRRGNDQAVTIVPHQLALDPERMPADPFGSPGAAYDRLREITDQALAMRWNLELETLSPWLEQQTIAVEESLHLLKALRVGPRDVYAVANGRVAIVYEQIAVALTRGSALADQLGFTAEWKDQQDLIWERTSAFWTRCVRGCGSAGPHVDAWELRCRAGLDKSLRKSPRQPK